MSAVRLFRNPRAARATAYGADLQAVLSGTGFAAARAEITTWPGYASTPMIELPGIARRLGIERLWYKDEAGRFGLGSFKALGGAYAVSRLLAAEVERRAGRAGISASDLLGGRHRDVTRAMTVTSATDGNHGRAVAWGAAQFGCRCVIFVPAGVSAGRREAIARWGAEVREVAGTYDDAVRHAAETAAREGWVVVSDTSYPGYADIPRQVMYGYGVMAEEALSQLPPTSPPTHVFVHAGVGALAAAVCARFWQHWGETRPRFVVVEPERADCCYRSAVAGRLAKVPGDLDTVMAGLSAGEMSLIAWDILKSGADDFMTIVDEAALDCVRLLAEGRHGDRPLVAGETGVAGLAGLIAAMDDGAARAVLGLDAGSRVLVFGSEGATDPAIYRRITGRAPEEVSAGAG